MQVSVSYTVQAADEESCFCPSSPVGPASPPGRSQRCLCACFQVPCTLGSSLLPFTSIPSPTCTCLSKALPRMLSPSLQSGPCHETIWLSLFFSFFVYSGAFSPVQQGPPGLSLPLHQPSPRAFPLPLPPLLPSGLTFSPQSRPLHLCSLPGLFQFPKWAALRFTLPVFSFQASVQMSSL